MKSKRVRVVTITLAVLAAGGIVFVSSGDDGGRKAAFGDNTTAATVELIQNGGFERPVNEGSDWVLGGTFSVQSGVRHSGSYALRSYEASGEAFAYQDVDIPASTTKAEFSFWIAAGNRTATEGFLSVEVDPSPTSPPREPGDYGPQPTSSTSKVLAKFGRDYCTSCPTLGVFRQHVRYSLAQYRGQTVRIYFAVVAPDIGNSPLFVIDDVSVKVSTTTTPDLLVGTTATTPAREVSIPRAYYPRYVGPATFLVRTTGLNFTANQSVNPAAQTFTLVNNVITPPLSYTIADDVPWLTTSPSSGSLSSLRPQPVTASVNVAGLAAGEYSGAITITAPGASGAPFTVPVALTVVATTPPQATASASVSSIGLTGARAGANPASKGFTLTTSAGLQWAAASNRSWLKVSPANGTGTATITVSAATAGLGLGSYQGTVTITAPGVKAVNVTVRLDITTSGQPAPASY